jgi:ribosomal protein S18 acetylase RimI-like enzyme
MENLLDNPVYYALVSGDQDKGFGSEYVRAFVQEISPFAGFQEQLENGFEELKQMLPPGRSILFATRNEINQPKGWRLMRHIHGSQFVFSTRKTFDHFDAAIQPLNRQHISQMIDLAALTKPGPFDIRTIEFGEYHGIFNDNRLVAMTGQRLHTFYHTEISAVCTHPDHLGKGYAASLLKHQIDKILTDGKIPFLHVRSDNKRAIEIYERLGFNYSGVMNFYFLENGS